MGYYEENREKRLEYQKKYNQANREKISSYFKSYYINNYENFQKKNRMGKYKKTYKITGNKKPEIKKLENNKINLVSF